MSLAILSLATAVPSQAIEQLRAMEIARRICCESEEQAALLPSLYRQTGIESRHMVFGEEVLSDVQNGTDISGSIFLPRQGNESGPTTAERMKRYVEEALPLTTQASSRALEAAGTAPTRISHLVTVTCTGFSAPGVDVGLIRNLGLSPSVQRVQVGFMGCHGAINGLRVAHALAKEEGAQILMCATELCSLHYYYGWEPKKLVANALFADGAAALVGVSRSAAIESSWNVMATGSCLFPDCEYAMTWAIGDHGFEMGLSTRVPSLIASHLCPWLTAWLQDYRLDVASIGSWAIHPGGPRILSAVQETLNLPAEALKASREVLAQFGNMSSPTLLFILQRLRQERAPLPCVGLGFGPGLVAEAVLIA